MDDFFYDMDRRYQEDKVISAIDVDLYVNGVTEEENLDELEELVHRLRRSPATADALPSTSHAVIRAYLNAGRIDDLMRILNDRWNYGVFVDYHIANILMDEFLKQGNTRDAAKVASLLMLEEDFGSPTSCTFAVLSCLKYIQNPTPEPWDTSVKEESEEEVKIRLFCLRNPYFDDHFDLTNANHVVGKTLALGSRSLKGDDVLSKSAELMGWALYSRWDKVESFLKQCAVSKIPVAKEALNHLSDLCEKALAEIEASPTKSLSKPKALQFPGVNLDEKEVAEMWKRLNYPENEKIIPRVKELLSSNQLKSVNDFNMIQKTENLLSSALAEREDKEIEEQLKAFEDWNEKRVEELNNQMTRFRKFEVMESVEARKKDLKEKEEVIFFFDNEEEWMMRLPADEQQGYKLSTEYYPQSWIPFVRSVPPKKEKKKKKTTTTT
ncbi:28S ribosomal protein S27, mitochondrial [Orchesella cincta]|uniref:28S ribosomal protein S27, mitochondrial n=1 Tax=Orchesella cincta TaxID=48709 RepID=A0A1D2MSR3_ORCCI|nr:28S ribosomal protein S27, mitochondrial [Orchesella cincta]